jgi:transposase
VVRLFAGNELCRRFMAIPGVGPVAALSFMTAIDDRTRFRRSRDVAAVLRTDVKTLAVWHLERRSGTHQQGRRPGHAPRALRGGVGPDDALKGKDKVKSWGERIAKRSCHRKATVAVARKLTVIMHAMWTDGTFYVGDPGTDAREVRPRTAAKQRMLLGAHA